MKTGHSVETNHVRYSSDLQSVTIKALPSRNCDFICNISPSFSTTRKRKCFQITDLNIEEERPCLRAAAMFVWLWSWFLTFETKIGQQIRNTVESGTYYRRIVNSNMWTKPCIIYHNKPFRYCCTCVYNLPSFPCIINKKKSQRNPFPVINQINTFFIAFCLLAIIKINI